MDIGKSLTYYFDDPRWVNKLLIGTVVLILSSLLSIVLVGLLGYLIVIGYSLDVLRNVRNGERYPLPEWRDRWGEWLVQGLRVVVATLVWALPAIIIGLATIVPAVMMGSDSDFWITMGGLGIACLSCLIVIWSIVVVLVLPAIYIRVAEKETLGSGLAFGEIIAFTRQHIGDVIIVSIVFILASIVLSLLGSLVGALLCGIGLFVTVPLASLITYLIQAHLYAQVGASPTTTALVPAPEPVAPTPAPVQEPVVTPPVVSVAEQPVVEPDVPTTTESE